MAQPTEDTSKKPPGDNAGKCTPAEAAAMRHADGHVLGEKDSTYHGKKS